MLPPSFQRRFPRRIFYHDGIWGHNYLQNNLLSHWRGEATQADALGDLEKRSIRLDSNQSLRDFGGTFFHELLHQAETPLASLSSLSCRDIQEIIAHTIGANLWKTFCQNPNLLLILHECATGQNNGNPDSN